MRLVPRKIGEDWFLEIVFEPGDCYSFAERDYAVSLILARRDFVQVIYETMSWWPSIKLSKMYRPLGEVMLMVEFVEGIHGKAFSKHPSVSTPFTDECVINSASRDFTVFFPIKAFVLGFLNEFAERPFLELRHFSVDFQNAFEKKWWAALEVLGDREALEV